MAAVRPYDASRMPARHRWILDALVKRGGTLRQAQLQRAVNRRDRSFRAEAVLTFAAMREMKGQRLLLWTEYGWAVTRLGRAALILAQAHFDVSQARERRATHHPLQRRRAA